MNNKKELEALTRKKRSIRNLSKILQVRRLTGQNIEVREKIIATIE